MGAVMILFVTEALPLPVTALLAAALSILLGVAPARTVFAPFADPLIFLFIGSFMVAQSIEFHKLDKRLAYGVLSNPAVGGHPHRILFAYGLVTAGISAFISNTATTAMMFPIGMSLISVLSTTQSDTARRISPAFGMAVMLMASFASTIGGYATPIGTPTNLLGLGYLKNMEGFELSFFKWVLLALPVVLGMYIFVFLVFRAATPKDTQDQGDGAAKLQEERASLGEWTPGQRSTLAAFLLMAVLWITPGVLALLQGENSPAYQWFREYLPESVIALFGALLLFILPGGKDAEGKAQRVLTWKQASGFDWGIIILYGGGVMLGELASQTGLAANIGWCLCDYLPAGGGSWGLVIAATLIAAAISETTSNTASVTLVVPVVIHVAHAAGVDPVEPALAATFASSLGFMLPVSTPCNAMVYSSGHVPITKMIRYGLLLDIFGAVIIAVVVKTLVPLLR